MPDGTIVTVGERYYSRFCEQYLSPVLTAAGFERGGLTYRRRDDRTWRMVAIEPYDGYRLPARVFQVEVGSYVVPDRPWLSDELRVELDAAVPDVSKGQFRATLSVPSESRHDPLAHMAWGTLSDDDTARAGREVQHIVSTEAVPCLAAVFASGAGPGADDWPSLHIGTVQPPFRDRQPGYPLGDPLYQW